MDSLSFPAPGVTRLPDISPGPGGLVQPRPQVATPGSPWSLYVTSRLPGALEREPWMEGMTFSPQWSLGHTEPLCLDSPSKRVRLWSCPTDQFLWAHRHPTSREILCVCVCVSPFSMLRNHMIKFISQDHSG